MLIKFNVFGSRMSVMRENHQWLLYRESDTGIRARIYDVVIPPELNESELAGYLADIYHEHAMGTESDVQRLN